MMHLRVAKRGDRTTAADYARRSLGPEPGRGSRDRRASVRENVGVS